eukprot:TRINITY_DN16406_c0_g1_i1.p1 TRINITY_DN16406_c0_g1~~TRINITY_DN16406_c0_g1_i1.p1  ORF type:complete len:436 (+),score=59.79 TRINITY_DN16406_c0_g1_i1:68-1309(+)
MAPYAATHLPTQRTELPVLSPPSINVLTQVPSEPAPCLPEIPLSQAVSSNDATAKPANMNAEASSESPRVVRRPRAGLLRRQAQSLPDPSVMLRLRPNPAPRPGLHGELDVPQKEKLPSSNQPSPRQQESKALEHQRQQSKRRSNSKQNSNIEVPPGEALKDSRTTPGRHTMSVPSHSVPPPPRRSSRLSSFQAFREARRLQRVAVESLPAASAPTAELDLAKLARRYGLGESDVRARFEDFVNMDSDGDQALSLAEFEELIRLWCGLTLDQDSLPPHLTHSKLGPSLNGVLRFEDALEWLKEHQWAEEILVPDPDERKFRHFCRIRGYPLADMDMLKEHFQRTDSNRSGCIDIQEFGELLSKMEGHEVSNAKLRQLFYEIDLDGSGTINFYEFAVWFVTVGPDSAGNRLAAG